MQVYVTSVRTGRGFHAHKGSGSHLSAGHTVDGVVDEDDGDVLTAVQRMDGFGRTDTCQVAVALIGEYQTVRPQALNGGGKGGSVL